MQSVRVGGFTLNGRRRRTGQVCVKAIAPIRIRDDELSELVGMACNRVNATVDDDSFGHGRFTIKTLCSDDVGRVLNELKRLIVELFCKASESFAAALELSTDPNLHTRRSRHDHTARKRTYRRAPSPAMMSRRLRRLSFAAI